MYYSKCSNKKSSNHKKVVIIPVVITVLVVFSFSLPTTAREPAPAPVHFNLDIICRSPVTFWDNFFGYTPKQYIYARGITSIAFRKTSSHTNYTIRTRLKRRARIYFEYPKARINRSLLEHFTGSQLPTLLTEKYSVATSYESGSQTSLGINIKCNRASTAYETMTTQKSTRHILDFMLDLSARDAVVFDPLISSDTPICVRKKRPKLLKKCFKLRHATFAAKTVSLYIIRPQNRKLRQQYQWNCYVAGETSGQATHIAHELVLLKHPVRFSWSSRADFEYLSRKTQNPRPPFNPEQAPSKSCLKRNRDQTSPLPTSTSAPTEQSVTSPPAITSPPHVRISYEQIL